MPSIDAFVSYNVQDREFARNLCAALRELNVTVWFAEEHRDSHGPWRRNVLQAIEDSKCFLALFGPHGVAEEQEFELDQALSLRDRLGLIPILIKGYKATDDNPYAKSLRRSYSYVDLQDGLRDDAVLALATNIKDEVIVPETRTPMAPLSKPSCKVLTFTGGTGAGTGYLCGRLVAQLTQELGRGSCQVLAMERYYTGSAQTRPVRFTNTFQRANFENPKIIALSKLATDVEALQRGVVTKVPIYDLQKHATEDFEAMKPPTNLILLQGAYLLHNKRIRDLSDLTVFVDVDADVRFATRVLKDVGLKVPLADILRYYCRRVKPAFEKWIRPYQSTASLPLRIQTRDPKQLRAELNLASMRVINVLRAEKII